MNIAVMLRGWHLVMPAPNFWEEAALMLEAALCAMKKCCGRTSLLLVIVIVQDEPKMSINKIHTQELCRKDYFGWYVIKMLTYDRLSGSSRIFSQRRDRSRRCSRSLSSR